MVATAIAGVEWGNCEGKGCCMFDKLVDNIISGAKKHRWLLAPAAACLFVLFGIRGMAERAERWKKHFGTGAPILLALFLVFIVAIVGIGGKLPMPQRSIPDGGALSVEEQQNAREKQLREVLAQVEAQQAEEDKTAGDPVQTPKDSVPGGQATPDQTSPEDGVPYDREHPKTTTTPPEPAEDLENKEQNQLLSDVEQNIKRLKTNQVTPDWAPDLFTANSGKNYGYYKAAWSAYEGLTEANRAKLDSELLDYLLTCHKTVGDQ